METLRTAKIEDYLNQKRGALARHEESSHQIHQIDNIVSISSTQAEEILRKDIGQMRFFNAFSTRLAENAVSSRNEASRKIGKRILITAVAPVLVLSALIGTAASGRAGTQTVKNGLAVTAVALIAGASASRLALERAYSQEPQSRITKKV